MTSYWGPVFNSYVWLRTLLAFIISRMADSLCAVLDLDSDRPTNPAWIRSLLEKKFDHVPQIAGIEKSSKTLHGGMVGLIYRVQLQYRPQEEDGSKIADRYPQSLVVKEGKKNFLARLASTFFQNSREAIFYQKLVPKHSIFSSCVPQIYHSSASLVTGKFMVVMEDLTGKAVPANHLLGNQCWGTISLTTQQRNIPSHEVFRTVFLKMAEIHAQFWMDQSLLKDEWLRGVRWRKGSGRISWEASFGNMRKTWETLSSSSSINIFTPLQREAIGSLLKRSTWRAWQLHNNIVKSSTPFTLTHGDFHAGNVLWMWEKKEEQAIFVDWSEVGIGCPFTDLAQFMISNAPIEFRRENERQLFDEYYNHLVKFGVSSSQFPQEKCWERYKAGGIERWLQLLILLARAQIPEFALLWFSGQVESFLRDHSSSIPECFNTVYCLPLTNSPLLD